MSNQAIEIDEVLEVLSDDRWHDLREFVKDYESLPREQKTRIKEILEESEKVGLIETDGHDEKDDIKIRGTDFVKKITELPEEGQ